METNLVALSIYAMRISSRWLAVCPVGIDSSTSHALHVYSKANQIGLSDGCGAIVCALRPVYLGKHDLLTELLAQCVLQLQYVAAQSEASKGDVVLESIWSPRRAS